MSALRSAERRIGTKANRPINPASSITPHCDSVGMLAADVGGNANAQVSVKGLAREPLVSRLEAVHESAVPVGDIPTALQRQL